MNNKHINTELHIAKKLRELRKKKKVKQKEIASFLGVKANTVSAWEIGQNAIDLSTLLKICDFLGVSINEFDLPDEEKSPDVLLSEDEKTLIVNFRKLSLNNQLKALGFIEIMSEED